MAFFMRRRIYIKGMKGNPIGIFDSGSGGLTVLDTCRRLLPDENFVYVSDFRTGGWGNLSERQIGERAESCVKKLLEYDCKAIVAACNTATEVAISQLRSGFPVPFVGVEPALRPALKAYPDGKILVLCTPATARQQKFRALLRDVGSARVEVRPLPKLAARIESNLDKLDTLRDDAERSMDGADADAVVLGCTHYVFIRYMFEQLAGGAEHVFDGNDGVARRLQSILREQGIAAPAGKMGQVIFDTI